MLNWDMINRAAVVIECDNEEETVLFLQECEKRDIKWKSGLKATNSSKCYRNISTNGGQYLTECVDGLKVIYTFKHVLITPSCDIPQEDQVKEFNGESCSWCKNEKNCQYNRRHMEYTREAVKNISYCTKAYCIAKVTCDYYVKDEDKYRKHNIGECNGG